MGNLNIGQTFEVDTPLFTQVFVRVNKQQFKVSLFTHL